MRTTPRLRGWAVSLIAAAICGVVAATSFVEHGANEARPNWLAVFLTAGYAAWGLYEFIKYPAGRPQNESTQDGPEFTEFVVYGLIALTVIASFVAGASYFVEIKAMQ